MTFGTPSYTLQLLVKRNAGSADLTATISNTNGGWSSIVFTGTDTANFTTAFDTFVFRPATNGFTATNFTFTEFKVELVTTNNQSPVPGSHAVTASRNQSLALAVTNLLATDTDPDGDSLSITAVSSMSTNNGTVALAAGIITYTPPAGYTGADRFSYTLTDSRGASATGYVFVSVIAPSLAKIGRLSVANGAFQFQFTGTPGASYLIQAKTNLADFLWLTIGTNSIDSNGFSTFIDPDYSNLDSRFYRVATP